jgi:hypothetical protein
VRRDAIIDPTGAYRYSLTREWDAALPRVCFCMLNPSTADALRDDPTIRRCIGFARSWGYGSLEVINLFAYRATSPGELRAADDPVGPQNDWHIGQAAGRASLIIVAWGAHGSFLARDVPVAERLAGALCLGMTRTGYPRHPLYVRGDTRPVAFLLS